MRTALGGSGLSFLILRKLFRSVPILAAQR
jgi:hypothetical protein